jgi:transcription initiation factor TFIIIB Brf1 subunit/transcription initiation factor TFIIB
MLASAQDKCAECGAEIMDVGEELVCRLCGVVASKEVVEIGGGGGPLKAVDYTGQSLGGYLGPIEYGPREKFSKGISASPSTFGYLKLVSDFAGREESAAYTCLKLIERVCEKLALPRVVWNQAMVIAKKLYGRGERVGANSGAVSAYAIITACKIERVTSVDVKEIIAAHRLMGKRVKFASLVRLSLESPFKSEARRAEDYVPRVIARLASSENLSLNLEEAGVRPSAYLARLREAALVCLSVVGESRRGGHSPIGIAAASVYAGEMLLSNLEKREARITQRSLARQAGVAEYTVREQYGELFRPTTKEALIRAIQIRRL